MAQPWLKAGCHAYLFDKQHPSGVTSTDQTHNIGGLIENNLKLISQLILSGRVVFVAAFPDCTDLAITGGSHFKSKALVNPHFQCQAMNLVYLCRDIAQLSGAPWFIENPISMIASFWRKPDHYFHPYQYGGYLPADDIHPQYPRYICPQDAYAKKTALWTGGGFIMPEPKPVPLANTYTAQFQKLGGRSLKTKNIRSATPRGFAQAVFEANKPDFL
jgi:hypothetical protein